MKNNKWSVESFNSKPIHVVLFVSRNKDNSTLENFKERRMSFITHKTIDELEEQFNDFVSHGREGEMCRMYYSVNARDPQKIHAQLMHFLFDNPDFNLCSIEPKLAGIAAQKECAAEKKWMFDFDIDDKSKIWDFIIDVCFIAKIDIKLLSSINPANMNPGIRAYKTPNGYAIVVDHGFDTRELMKYWGDKVTLKRDDLLCCKWKIKEA